jgi:hypothetical protein
MGVSCSWLEKVNDFLETFKARNLTGNERLQALVDKAKGLLKGVDAESVKADDEFRKRVCDRFSELKSTLDGMIVTKPTRRIVLED